SYRLSEGHKCGSMVATRGLRDTPQDHPSYAQNNPETEARRRIPRRAQPWFASSCPEPHGTAGRHSRYLDTHDTHEMANRFPGGAVEHHARNRNSKRSSYPRERLVMIGRVVSGAVNSRLLAFGGLDSPLVDGDLHPTLGNVSEHQTRLMGAVDSYDSR